MRVWVGGTFDLIHCGHAALLREAGRLANLPGMRPGRTLTVAVNSSDFVERYRGRAPVQSLADRCEMVASMRWVNEVQINDGTEQPALILRAQTDVILVGDDWAPPRDYLTQIGVTHTWLLEHQVDVRFMPRVGGHSSTRLKAEVSGRRLA